MNPAAWQRGWIFHAAARMIDCLPYRLAWQHGLQELASSIAKSPSATMAGLLVADGDSFNVSHLLGGTFSGAAWLYRKNKAARERTRGAPAPAPVGIGGH
jgi:hypothetical protein